jgi:hypothetical protein
MGHLVAISLVLAVAPAMADSSAPSLSSAKDGFSACVTAPTFDGEAGWLLLGEASLDASEILARALKLQDACIEAEPVATSLFANLRPGLHVVVHGRYQTREAALAAAAQLRAKRVRVEVKASGSIRAAHGALPSRLVQVRGVATLNEEPRRIPIVVTPGDANARWDAAPLASFRADARGRFIWWTSAVGDATLSADIAREWMRKGSNMLKEAGETVTLRKEDRSRVDVQGFESSDWFCGE